MIELKAGDRVAVMRRGSVIMKSVIVRETKLYLFVRGIGKDTEIKFRKSDGFEVGEYWNRLELKPLTIDLEAEIKKKIMIDKLVSAANHGRLSRLDPEIIDEICKLMGIS